MNEDNKENRVSTENIVQSFTQNNLEEVKEKRVAKTHLCLLCYRSDKHFFLISSRTGKARNLENKIKDVLNLTEKEEGSTKKNKCFVTGKVCRKCMLNIDSFYTFKLTSRQNILSNVNDLTKNARKHKSNSSFTSPERKKGFLLNEEGDTDKSERTPLKSTATERNVLVARKLSFSDSAIFPSRKRILLPKPPVSQVSLYLCIFSNMKKSLQCI